MSKLEESANAYRELKPTFEELNAKFKRLSQQLDNGENIAAYGRVSFSQEGEDMVMREFFENLHQIKKGFYIDIGAYHDYSISNTAYYYLQGWRGINVEPNPEGFKLLEKERPNDINLNVGVADQKGELNYYYYGANDTRNTFSQDHMGINIRRPDLHPQKVLKIPVIDVNEVFSYAKGREVDFLSIDVESFEFTILKNLDFEKYRPKMILVELLHTTMVNLEQDPIYQLLISKNYRLYAHTMRTFFFKRNDMEKHIYEPDSKVKI